MNFKKMEWKSVDRFMCLRIETSGLREITLLRQYDRQQNTNYSIYLLYSMLYMGWQTRFDLARSPLLSSSNRRLVLTDSLQTQKKVPNIENNHRALQVALYPTVLQG